ncbi:MAG: DUF4012 domain-containing protein [Patescibacteria group bacterium]
MPKTTKKPQLRRCAICQRVGHNKSTCPEQLQEKKRDNQPFKFFVHHVNYNSPDSPHVVNLKEQHHDIWKNVDTAAPEEELTNQEYYFHHKPEEAPKIKNQAPIKIPSFSPKIPKIHKPKIKKNYFKHVTLRRAVALATLIALVFILPSSAQSYYTDLQSTVNKVAGNSTQGFIALQDSTTDIMAGNLDDAQKSLGDALKNFDAALATLNSNHQLVQTIASTLPIIGNEIQSRQKLILAGQSIALGNTYMVKGLAEIKNSPSSTLTESMNILNAYLQYAIPTYNEALKNLGQVDPKVLPFEYQNSFNQLKTIFTAFSGDLENLSNLNQSLQEIFGGKGLRRYLLVFQNPAELRATGGFAGSFALLDVVDGKITNMDVPAGGSYDLQGQLSESVEPPTPLLFINKRWEFQDSNWFPDFPASAQNMLWFYRHSRNITADGVIAINATVLNRILSIIGPVTAQKYNLTLTAANALPAIQNIVEYGPDKANNKPKQILSDLAPMFVDYLKNIKPQDILPILTNLHEALQQKEVQAYFTNNNTEETINNFGWGGKILKTSAGQDYLMVVNTNIQGQKSDAKIKQTISHQAVVQPDGTILDSVVVKREHTGVSGEQLYGQTNIDYIRVYVPQGSELVSASGFSWPDEQHLKVPDKWTTEDKMLNEFEKEINIDPVSGTRVTNEFSKTAFGNWIATLPGQTSEVQFVYKLPFKAFNLEQNKPANKWAGIFQSSVPSSKYQLVVQNQSGIDSNFDNQIIYPDLWHPVWKDGTNITLASNGATINNQLLNQDMIWSMILNQDNKIN